MVAKQECMMLPGIHIWELRQSPRALVRIRLSKFNMLLEASERVGLLGRLQQYGIVRITFDPALDDEAYVELTEKGQQFISVFFRRNGELAGHG